MLSDKNRDKAMAFWQTELGVKHFASGIQVQAHNPRAAWNLADRALYFEHAEGAFISVKQIYLTELNDKLLASPRTPLDVFVSVMADKGAIVGNGPAYVGYLDSLGGAVVPICRITRHDSRVHRVAQEYEEDWSVFGLTEDSVGLFAVIEDGQVLGLSHFEVWGGVIAHIGVITIPSARGRGIGEMVVRQATQEALKSGLLPQYRTLWDNAPSIRIAEKLGFSHFATTVVVRCREDSAP